MRSLYHSLLKKPPKSLHDRRIAQLQSICDNLRQYHSNAIKAKKNKILAMSWRYETLLDNIQLKLR